MEKDEINKKNNAKSVVAALSITGIFIATSIYFIVNKTEPEIKKNSIKSERVISLIHWVENTLNKILKNK